MALPVNIDELINGQTVEWERIEFREGWNPERTLKTICAFANEARSYFKCTFKIHPEFLKDEADTTQVPRKHHASTPQATPQVTPQDTPQVPRKLRC